VLNIRVFINSFPGLLPENTRFFFSKAGEIILEYLSRLPLYLIYNICRFKFLVFFPYYIYFCMASSSNPSFIGPKNYILLFSGLGKVVLSPGQAKNSVFLRNRRLYAANSTFISFSF
jgi:hypothetical protein